MENKIYSAIAGVMNDITAVGKNRTNKMQNFKYRGVDDLYNALHPALAKNKVFIVPEMLEQQRLDAGKTKNGAQQTLVICKIKYRLYAEDGSYIESVVIGEAIDTGDKATNKAMAIAYKYLCFQVLCIPTEEMEDPDGQSPEIHKEEPRSVTEKQATEPKLISAAELNQLLKELQRTGVTVKCICDAYKKNKINDLTNMEFQSVMRRLAKTPNKPEGEQV